MKNIPNILTVARILLIPLFVYLVALDNLIGAGLVLIISGLTDFLDGRLARRFGWVTALGKVLDPVADKLTQMAVSVCFIIKLQKFWGFFAFLIIKELIMLAFSGWLIKKRVKLEGAQWFGKVNTFVFYGIMIAILLIPMQSNLIIPLLIIAVVCSIFTVLMYIPEFIRHFKKIDGDDTLLNG